MSEEEEIVSKDCYYKDKPDNEFYNYTIHGLNIEGIKKYYSIPINSKYHHMVQLNKDLKDLLENSKKLEKERQKKYERNNIYDDERLIKMYGIKKEDNKNDNINCNYNTLGNNIYRNNTISKSTKLFERKKTGEKTFDMQLDNNGIDNTIGKKELKHNLLNKNIFIKNANNKNTNTLNHSIEKFTNKNCFNKNNRYNSLKKINKTKDKEVSLPFIKPRKIIIEYHLTNDAGIEKINKNYGHNNYMGASFNPFNYSCNPKNRKTRNVYGSLFLH